MDPAQCGGVIIQGRPLFTHHESSDGRGGVYDGNAGKKAARGGANRRRQCKVANLSKGGLVAEEGENLDEKIMTREAGKLHPRHPMCRPPPMSSVRGIQDTTRSP